MRAVMLEVPAGDESRDKLGFYTAMPVSEVLLVDPVTRDFELLGLAADGSCEPVDRDDSGEVPCHTLGVVFSVAAGPKFRIVCAGDVREV